ncbi:MAG: Mth938-like domain-containing protein [Desulfobacteraceae bacterium]|nr:Mth938-like domain-containing protein [Desulfobacteraceae bacterium]
MRIEDYRFGSMRINGETYKRDLKIIKNSVRPDWWPKSSHLVTRDDIDDILKAEPEILVLGKGSPGQMEPDPALTEELEKKGIRLISRPTQEASEEFNRLQEENKNVAAGFHLTC